MALSQAHASPPVFPYPWSVPLALYMHIHLLEVAKQLHVLKYMYLSLEVYKCIHTMEVDKVLTTTVASS